MSSGFRYVLAGACVIALLFIGLSLWPYLNQMDIVWRQPDATGQPAPAPAQPAQLPRAAQPSLAAPAPLYSAQAYSQTQTQPSRIVMQSPAVVTQQAVQGGENEQDMQWLLTVDNAIVRKQPGGEPYLAPCVSHAPLTVFSGSYLREVRREHDWVLILSPSKMMGWVHERQVRPANM